MKNKGVFDKKEKAMPEKIKGQRDVFISYKRENAAFVTRLYEELEHHNISAWVDLSKLHKEPGEKYQEKIRKAIESARFLLLIYTEREGCSIEGSDFIINKELAYAVEKKKEILFYPQDPINLNTSRIKPYIEKIQWLDTVETARYQLDTQESVSDEKRLSKLSEMVNRRDGFSVFEDENIFLIRVALQRKLGKITVFGNYKKLCGTGTDEFYGKDMLDICVVNKSLFIPVPSRLKPILEKLNFFREDKVKEVVRHLKMIKPDNDELRRQFVDFVENRSDIYPMPIVYGRLQHYLKQGKYCDIKLPGLDGFGVNDLIDVVSEMVACNFIEELESGKTMFNGAELGVYNISDNRTNNSEHHFTSIQLYYSDYFTFKCMTEMYHVLCSIDGGPFVIKNVQDICPLAPFLCSLGLGGYLAAYTDEGVSLMWTKRSSNISSGESWHFSYDETVSLLLDGAVDNEKHLIVGEENVVHIDTDRLLYRALKEEVGATREYVDEDNHGIFEVGIIRSERLEVELISQAVLHLNSNIPLREQIKEMHNSANDGYLEISKIEFLPLRDRKSLIGRLLTPESYDVFFRMQARLKENVGKKVSVGSNTLVEDGCFFDDGANIGDYCSIHRNVYIGKNVRIGDNVKIQNNNSIYEGVILEDGVFVGTNVSFINDRYPRAILRDGRRVCRGDWVMEKTLVRFGASIGAGAIIMCGVTIGKWAMIGAGAVVLEDVPDDSVVVGNPARVIGKCKH